MLALAHRLRAKHGGKHNPREGAAAAEATAPSETERGLRQPSGRSDSEREGESKAKTKPRERRRGKESGGGGDEAATRSEASPQQPQQRQPSHRQQHQRQHKPQPHASGGGSEGSATAGDPPHSSNKTLHIDDVSWKKNRGLNSKTSSTCASSATGSAPPSGASSATESAVVMAPSFVNAAPPNDPILHHQQLTARSHARTASVPASNTRQASPQEHQQMLQRAQSSVAAAAALRSHGLGDDRTTCISSSSSSGHSVGSNGSAGRRTRSRHGGSMSSTTSSVMAAPHQKPEVSVDVRHSGYLFVKRGLLKVAEKRFYFVARRSPELYSCKDETSFSLWLASGHPLDPHGGDAFAKASGLSPVLVGTVLRADGATDDGSNTSNNSGSHPERSFSVMMGSASKCTTLRFGAESADKATQWVDALQEVQVTKRHARRRHGKLASASDKKLLLPLNEHNALIVAGVGSDASEYSMSGQNDDEAEGQEDAEEAAIKVIRGADGSNLTEKVTASSTAKVPRVYTSGRLQSKPRTAEEDASTGVSTPTSQTESSPTSASASSELVEAAMAAAAGPTTLPPTPTAAVSATQSLPRTRSQRMDSVLSCSSTASGQSQGNGGGNVLLFVPAAGSSLTVSAAKVTKAQQELDALVAQGAKLPSRVKDETKEGDAAVEWRYGAPQYVLTDLAYVKGRLREPDATPLASYVEECCQTFIMEATHKARYDQWHSVCQGDFYLQVNDGACVSGAAITESDMFGLLYLGGSDLSSTGGLGDSDESQDPRAELAEAFPEGFPMEVLEVFTQPPQCYFSWRHWGPFSGKHRGVKGDGSRVELRGFGEMTVDASRMRSLRLFFKQQELFSSLRQASDRALRARRAAAASVAASLSSNAVPGRPLRAASAAVAPVARKVSSPGVKTNDIIEGLAQFTLEAKQQHRKQSK
ncbi:hypothetical protein BBJ28_00022079 [Nothophytophthora sp. Chile5]|nr:hypothetical protein BBJ28_00022079 [Nothophytophthora sp. Chile5]